MKKESNSNKLVVTSNKLVKNIKNNTLSLLNNKKIVNKNNLLIALGILLLIIVISLSLGKSDDIDYPAIYNNSDGDLYLMDKKGKEDDAIKLANGESVSNVIYANTSSRFVLFEKNENLYLYDAKEKGTTTKIVDNVITAAFTSDDKYIYAVDSENKLLVYNYKETKRLDKDVSNILGTTEDKILYEKENVLYVRSINPKKDDRNKVTEEYGSQVIFSKDGKYIMYTDNNRELFKYDVKKDKKEAVAKKVSSYYCDDKSCDKLFYVENDTTRDIYYFNGKEEEKVVSDIYTVYDVSIKDKQVVYAKMVDGNYSIYFQVVGKDPIKVENKVVSVRTLKLDNGKGIYYLTGDNEVKYVNIKGSKLGQNKTITKDVTGTLYRVNNGFAFIGDIDKNSQGTLYIAKKGRVKEIDKEVSGILVSNDGKRVYYLKDYKSSGDLYVSKGGKGKKIADDVYLLEYVNNDLLYYIKDYSKSKSRGDLYRYTNKSVKIASDVTRLASVPSYYDENK